MNTSTIVATLGDAPAAVAARVTAMLSMHGPAAAVEMPGHVVLPMVCPIAPPGAQAHVDTLQGYLMWGVGILFVFGSFVSIGAVAAGRVVNMPHASKAGVVGLAVIGVAIIGYFAVPPIIDAMMGTGCV